MGTLAYRVAARILSLQKPGEMDNHFAERLGLSPQTVSNYRAGSNGASLDSVTRVMQAVPNLSGEWLMLGTGPMLRYPPEAAEQKLAAIRAILTADEDDVGAAADGDGPGGGEGRDGLGGPGA